MAYKIRRFETPEGPLVLKFGFIPAEPTTAQLGEFVDHVCGTCEFERCCHRVAPSEEKSCSDWAISCKAYYSAELAYYKALHKKHYG